MPLSQGTPNLISVGIKFGVPCEKIDVVNLVLPYVFKFIDQIVTVLYFLCWCAVVADTITILVGSSVNSPYPLQCHHRS